MAQPYSRSEDGIPEDCCKARRLRPTNAYMRISFYSESDARLTAATLTLPQTTETPLSPRELAKREETLRTSRFLADWQSQMRGVPESALHD